jgi:hypothetical protein
MTLTVMAFFGGAEPLDQARLQAAADHALAASPDGASAEARALDQHFMLIEPQGSGIPDVRYAADLADAVPASGWITVWLPVGTDDVDRRAGALADQLHGDLDAHSTGVLEPRTHLDQAADAELPAYACIFNSRRPEHTRDEYIWYYRTHHAPLAVELSPLFRRYVTHRVLHARGPLLTDALTTQHFASLGDIDSHVRRRNRPTDPAINDVHNFVGRTDYYVGNRSAFAA